MLLMDAITESARQVLVNVHNNQRVSQPILQSYVDLAEKLKDCPRFIFDAPATRVLSEITLSRPKVIADTLQTLRIPYPMMWLEWEEAHREELRTRLNPFTSQKDKDTRPIPLRLGCLIESDGRAGQISWAWIHKPKGEISSTPNLAPLSAYFDLDRNDCSPPEKAFLTLGGPWKDSSVQMAALNNIWRSVKHEPNEWGRKTVVGLSKQVLELLQADVIGEWISALSALILITSVRTIRQETSDLSRLNKARAKRGARLLLDHTTVHLYIDPSIKANVQRRQPLGYVRKSPRVHLVGSYLNHRGDKHWIVFPFLRGQGERITRHVHLHG